MIGCPKTEGMLYGTGIGVGRGSSKMDFVLVSKEKTSEDKRAEGESAVGSRLRSSGSEFQFPNSVIHLLSL